MPKFSIPPPKITVDNQTHLRYQVGYCFRLTDASICWAAADADTQFAFSLDAHRKSNVLSFSQPNVGCDLEGLFYIVMQAETKYVRSGGMHIAYQVLGSGPIDIVFVPGWVSHVELAWEMPELSRFLHRLASFARLIVFDKRGTGLSDRVPNDKLPTLEERMDDLLAIMDAVDSERAALCGTSEGGVYAPFLQPLTQSERRRSLWSALSLNGSGVHTTRGRQQWRNVRRGTR